MITIANIIGWYIGLLIVHVIWFGAVKKKWHDVFIVCWYSSLFPVLGLLRVNGII